MFVTVIVLPSFLNVSVGDVVLTQNLKGRTAAIVLACEVAILGELRKGN